MSGRPGRAAARRGRCDRAGTRGLQACQAGPAERQRGGGGMTRPLRTHAELTPPSPVDVAVTTSIGAHGEAVTLWAEPGRSNGGPVPVWVTVQHQHTMMNTVRIEALSFTAPHVQSLPDDRVLVVGHGQAQVFDASGSLVRSADVGGGVTHVAATPSGNVWVANAEGLVRFGAD